MAEPIIYIVILATAVLFLSNIFRGEKESRETKRPRPGNRPRPQGADVDQFLEEINRRRREGNERRAAKAVPPAPATPSRRPEPRRPEPPQRTPRIPSESRPTRSARIPVLKEQTPLIVKAAPPVATRPSSEDVTPLVVAEAEPQAAASAYSAAQIPVRPPAPAAARLLPLLHSRETLRSAILLQEILSPPLARRRKRRLD